jgi:hypothetical protein
LTKEEADAGCHDSNVGEVRLGQLLYELNGKKLPVLAWQPDDLPRIIQKLREL